MTVQSLDRGMALLHLLAEAGQDGRRLADLQRETGLSKPTVHRLLATLKRHALVEQADNSKRYCLGSEIAVLGWSATRQLHDLKDQCGEDMAALASSTGDTSFLVVRSGYETICIDRQTGAYPVKAFTVDVGARRPVGIGATGIAFLAAMSTSQAEEILAALEPALKQYPASLQKIRAAVSMARSKGYALSDGTVLKGVRGLAMNIRNSRGKTVASMGIAAISERVSENRLPELLWNVRARISHIEQRLANTDNTATRSRRRVWRASLGIRG
jgi:DNA-binding IclR family transcriptional regulator